MDSKLPIPTYYADDVTPKVFHRLHDGTGLYCMTADVRELVEQQFTADAAKAEIMIQLRDRVCKAESQLNRLLEAANKIQYWHDRGDGMIVSDEAVRNLWQVIADIEAERLNEDSR